MILDIALSYEKMKMDQKDGKAPPMSQEEMLAAIDRVKGNNNVN